MWDLLYNLSLLFGDTAAYNMLDSALVKGQMAIAVRNTTLQGNADYKSYRMTYMVDGIECWQNVNIGSWWADSIYYN